ncbi:uncharacterized protein DS421_1g26900 [Arachis hypogaea]|nr:uncharacterized protein DS421_1g26900 [Arachis hypogaea]
MAHFSYFSSQSFTKSNNYSIKLIREIETCNKESGRQQRRVTKQWWSTFEGTTAAARWRRLFEGTTVAARRRWLVEGTTAAARLDGCSKERRRRHDAVAGQR